LSYFPRCIYKKTTTTGANIGTHRSYGTNDVVVNAFYPPDVPTEDFGFFGSTMFLQDISVFKINNVPTEQFWFLKIKNVP
jgi:hypothetical protein